MHLQDRSAGDLGRCDKGEKRPEFSDSSKQQIDKKSLGIERKHVQHKAKDVHFN